VVVVVVVELLEGFYCSGGSSGGSSGCGFGCRS
jgi:hypothetical protein